MPAPRRVVRLARSLVSSSPSYLPRNAVFDRPVCPPGDFGSSLRLISNGAAKVALLMLVVTGFLVPFPEWLSSISGRAAVARVGQRTAARRRRADRPASGRHRPGTGATWPPPIPGKQPRSVRFDHGRLRRTSAATAPGGAGARFPHTDSRIGANAASRRTPCPNPATTTCPPRSPSCSGMPAALSKSTTPSYARKDEQPRNTRRRCIAEETDTGIRLRLRPRAKPERHLDVSSRHRSRPDLRREAGPSRAAGAARVARAALCPAGGGGRRSPWRPVRLRQ